MRSAKALGVWILIIAIISSFFFLWGCADDSTSDTIPKPDLPPRNSDETGGSVASAGAGSALQALLNGAVQGIGSAISKKIMGVIMAYIFDGGGDGDPKILKDLSDLKDTLIDIDTQLLMIENQLKAIEAEIHISTSDIEKTILTNGLDPYIVQINQLWDQYLALHQTDGTWNKKPLPGLSEAILDSLDGVFAQLVGIHDGLTGEGDVSASIIRAVADNAAIHTNNGGDPLEAYLLLENYMGKVWRAQMRGASLMVEALRYREISNQKGLADYPQDAKYFMT